MTTKQKIVLQAKYKKGALILRNEMLPDLNHLNEGFYCSDAEITSRGKILINGVEREFCDMRLIIAERGVKP